MIAATLKNACIEVFVIGSGDAEQMHQPDGFINMYVLADELTFCDRLLAQIKALTY